MALLMYFKASLLFLGMLIELYKENEPVDILTVAEALKDLTFVLIRFCMEKVCAFCLL